MPKVTLTGLQCDVQLTLDLDGSNITEIQGFNQKAQFKEVESILKTLAEEEITKAAREIIQTLNQMKGV
jgi:hypothetical protein